MSSDDSAASAGAARTISEQRTLRNALRRTSVEITLFKEGFVDVAPTRGGKRGEHLRLDLRYLDPVPAIERVIAARWFYSALACALLAGLAVYLLRFDAVRFASLFVLGGAVCASIATLMIGLYRSCERTRFSTLHGRAPVLELVANWGSLKAFRAFVPVISAAIEEAAEQIGDDTAAFLRGEMREHYRLRGEGVLSTQCCADSTGRILAQFDVKI